MTETSDEDTCADCLRPLAEHCEECEECYCSDAECQDECDNCGEAHPGLFDICEAD